MLFIYTIITQKILKVNTFIQYLFTKVYSVHFEKKVYNNIMVLRQTNMFEESTKIVFSKPKTTPRQREEHLLSKKYEQLYEIYNEIYETLNIDVFEQREVIIIGKTIIAYPEEKQAEVVGTQFLPLDERIRRNHDYLENRKKEII